MKQNHLLEVGDGGRQEGNKKMEERVTVVCGEKESMLISEG